MVQKNKMWKCSLRLQSKYTDSEIMLWSSTIGPKQYKKALPVITEPSQRYTLITNLELLIYDSFNFTRYHTINLKQWFYLRFTLTCYSFLNFIGQKIWIVQSNKRPGTTLTAGYALILWNLSLKFCRWHLPSLGLLLPFRVCIESVLRT